MSPPVRTGPPQSEPPQPAPPPPQPPGWRNWLVPIGILLTVALLVFFSWRTGPESNIAQLSYSQFVTDVNQGKVAVSIHG